MHGAFDTFVQQFVNSNYIQKKKVIFYISCDLSFGKLNFHNNNVKRVFVYRGSGFSILINYFISIIKIYFSGVRCFVFFGYGAAPFFILLKILNCRIICNPDGIEWRRPVGKIKKLYFRFCQKIITKINLVRIFDSEVIKRYYNINYSAKGKTIYYPSVFENHTIKDCKNRSCERFYIIGRLLEENNTEMIVRAFMRLDTNKKLYIIGLSNVFFEKKIKPLVLTSKNIIYLGPIYDRIRLYNICKYFNFYIHGHSVGGTNPTLIEAISLQKKIISFNVSFNRAILKNNACYFKSENELYDILIKKKYLKIEKPAFIEEYSSNYINNEYFQLMN